jgi:hypothetical protein
MGHIHVGYNNPSSKTNLEIVKTMDLFLGVPSIILDTDTERRKLYGKAGAFRNKAYGVEYRVLSGFWITNDSLMEFAFNNTMNAIKFINDGFSIEKQDETQIEFCINNGDKQLAYELMSKYSININELKCVE